MSEFGFANEAINFAAEGLSDCKDNRLREWLAEEYEKRKDFSKALDLYLEIWQSQPGLSNYKNVKRLANTLEKWPILERGLIESLEKRQDYDLLTEIYLFEKNWSLAWDYADKIQRTRTWMSYSDIRLKLAEVSEKDCPDRSAKVYYDYAEKLINRRGRNNYAEASSLLKKMLNIFIRTGLQEEGEELIMKVRNEFRKLPALQDEMNKAGL